MPGISSTSASEPGRRQVAIAVAAVALALVVCDQLYGLVFDRLFASSTFNPAARVQMAGADTVIVGASGAHYSLDPAVLGGRIYNAAEDGQSGYYVATLLNALPAGSVRRVLYGFDPSDVVSGLAGPNVKHLARFAPFAASDSQFETWITGGKPLARLKLRSGFYRHRGIATAALRGWFAPPGLGTGFVPLDGIMTPPAQNPVTGGPAGRPSPSGLAMLQAVAAAVRRHDAELVVLMTPMYRYDRSRLAEFQPLIAAMRDSFAGLRLCDLTAPEDSRMAAVFDNHRHYRDGAHTNGAGASAYSQIIRDQIAGSCFR